MNPIRNPKSAIRNVLCLAGACMLAGSALSADTVIPQQLSGGKLYRDLATISYSTNVHYTQGATFQLTNMVAYSTANLGTNSVAQGLNGVTVQFAMSTSSSTTGTWVNATVQSAAAGTWYGTYPALPDASVVYWQCRITDASTNTYYYMMQKIYADPHM